MKSSPTASIIILVHSQANNLNETIESVLAQSFQDIELVVVAACTEDQISKLSNPIHKDRINYVYHSGKLSSALLTGICACKGEFIAILNAGDTVHRDKIQLHLDFLKQYPSVGATYNGHIDTVDSKTFLSLWRPPATITPADLLLGLPLSLNHLVLRRSWADHLVQFVNESDALFIQVPYILCQLSLAGCQFQRIDRILDFHLCQPLPQADKHFEKSIETEIKTLSNLFADFRCSQEICRLREKIFGKTYLALAYQAFMHREISLGQELLHKSIRFDRSILDMQARNFLEFIIQTSIQNGAEHEVALGCVFDQLPPDLAWITQYKDWTVTYSYLYRSVDAIMWKRFEEGKMQLTKAASMGIEPDKIFLHSLLKKVSDYEAEFGPKSTRILIYNLTRHFKEVGFRTNMGWFYSTCFINQAFRAYHNCQYDVVPTSILKAVLAEPSYLVNRGVIAIFIRSLTKIPWVQPSFIYS